MGFLAREEHVNDDRFGSPASFICAALPTADRLRRLGGGRHRGLAPWLDYRAEQSIVDPYKSFIEQLAAASPEARSELQRYLAASGRDSVASQDFLPLCATMLRQAQKARAQEICTMIPNSNFQLCTNTPQGMNVEGISPAIATLCNEARQP